MLFRLLLKSLKFIFKVFGISFGLFLLIFVFNYLIAERYIFPAPKPFSGSIWYNPYQDMDSLQWRRTNLHMHSHAWGGITNGSDNSNHKVWDRYRKLGYESIGISNYQFIDTLNASQPYYIPVYEHGYGIFKSHQLSIGAKKVLWYDLPFGQNIHHKQYILNRLRIRTELLSINHPVFFGGYNPNDFRYLTNYDFIEALNGYRNSIPDWDSALSAGKPVFLMADDDMHSLDDPGEVSRRLMMVNAPDNTRESILRALRAGNSYGVEIRMPGNETYESKTARFDSLSVITSVVVRNDTLFVTAGSEALEFRFFGQSGKLLSKLARSRHAFYALQPEDTYIRTVVLYSTPHDQEGISMYLNPIIRTNDGRRPEMEHARVDKAGTWVYRIIGFGSLLFMAINIVVLRRRFKK